MNEGNPGSRSATWPPVEITGGARNGEIADHWRA